MDFRNTSPRYQALVKWLGDYTWKGKPSMAMIRVCSRYNLCIWADVYWKYYENDPEFEQLAGIELMTELVALESKYSLTYSVLIRITERHLLERIKIDDLLEGTGVVLAKI